MSWCYFCGDDEELEEHHVIPQRYDPVKNETVKVCPECHAKIHELYSTLIGFLNPAAKVNYWTEGDGLSDSRMKELEQAFGEPPAAAFERALSENGGKMRPALESLNDRLRNSKGYDEEAAGLISPNTFYKWTEEFDLRSV